MDIIPLSKNYSAVFKIEIGAELYTFRTLYNSRFGNWSFDITKNDVEIITGVSMVLGADIIGPYNLNMGTLFMVDLDQTDLDATAFDIGERIVLVHSTEEEINNAIAV